MLRTIIIIGAMVLQLPFGSQALAQTALDPMECSHRQLHYEALELQRQLVHRVYWFFWIKISETDQQRVMAASAVGGTAGVVGIGAGVIGGNVPMVVTSFGFVGASLLAAMYVSTGRDTATPFLECAQQQTNEISRSPYWNLSAQNFMAPRLGLAERERFGQHYANLSHRMTQFRVQSEQLGCRLDFGRAQQLSSLSPCWRHLER